MRQRYNPSSSSLPPPLPPPKAPAQVVKKPTGRRKVAIETDPQRLSALRQKLKLFPKTLTRNDWDRLPPFLVQPNKPMPVKIYFKQWQKNRQAKGKGLPRLSKNLELINRTYGGALEEFFYHPEQHRLVRQKYTDFLKARERDLRRADPTAVFNMRYLTALTLLPGQRSRGKILYFKTKGRSALFLKKVTEPAPPTATIKQEPQDA